MNQPDTLPSSSYRPLLKTWLALVGLTLLSVMLSQRLHGAAWLQLLVAAIVWLKGELIARHFVETRIAHPFIRRVTHAFIAFTPVALVLTAFFGSEFARLASI
ncbi:hypothetical protein LZ012_11435 [Dechloromonas sp. XY25]|uniref:Prokaryotic cytochrome C oxidase subunit IV family protein n=1 Tax=Dechloromonas hankyongensis TaxID=2908002 RepID=A0ABS9K379_9RHOO|nr:hypothetical protein [Dechloromonas hankyongensis]MCG2577605.1 hypothetical protein [Dechloromonas hankyongensis]